MSRPSVLFALLSLVFAACALEPVHTSQLVIRPTRPIVATKIARPLYVVLDPAQVPDEYTVPERTIKELTIFEIREFVRRDLRAALETYFDHVVVVTPSVELPEGALVAQVQIQGFATQAGAAGATGAAYGRMDWAFAIREPGANDLAFSYAESVTGTSPILTRHDSDEMIESTYRVALEHLITKLGEPGVIARLGGA